MSDISELDQLEGILFTERSILFTEKSNAILIYSLCNLRLVLNTTAIDISETVHLKMKILFARSFICKQLFQKEKKSEKSIDNSFMAVQRFY